MSRQEKRNVYGTGRDRNVRENAGLCPHSKYDGVILLRLVEIRRRQMLLLAEHRDPHTLRTRRVRVHIAGEQATSGLVLLELWLLLEGTVVDAGQVVVVGLAGGALRFAGQLVVLGAEDVRHGDKVHVGRAVGVGDGRILGLEVLECEGADAHAGTRAFGDAIWLGDSRGQRWRIAIETKIQLLNMLLIILNCLKKLNFQLLITNYYKTKMCRCKYMYSRPQLIKNESKRFSLFNHHLIIYHLFFFLYLFISYFTLVVF